MVSEDRTVLAVHGRYIDSEEPRMRTAGPKSDAVFATDGALSATKLGITEAPIDALSLASRGLPSLGLCGTSWPDWLPNALLGKQVLLAFDADEAGDDAAGRLGGELESLRVTHSRLRPPQGKDWNDALLAGRRPPGELSGRRRTPRSSGLTRPTELR
jgi:DNA primase